MCTFVWQRTNNLLSYEKNKEHTFLYLCYKLKKNVDPEKDIMFRQQIPLEYKTYLDIISGVVPLSDLGY